MPILISSGSRKGGGGGFKLFLVFAVAFAFGVFVGMRLDSIRGTAATDRNNEFADIDDTVSRPQASPKPLKDPWMNPPDEGSNNALNPERNQDVDTAAAESPNPPEDGSYTKAAVEPSPALESPSRLESNDKSGEYSTGAPGGDDKYTLQVAAFKEIGRAQIFADELKEKGYYPYINSISNSRGEGWKLIRLGKFKTVEEAQAFADFFEEKENISVLVKELDRTALSEKSEPTNPILP